MLSHNTKQYAKTMTYKQCGQVEGIKILFACKYFISFFYPFSKPLQISFKFTFTPALSLQNLRGFHSIRRSLLLLSSQSKITFCAIDLTNQPLKIQSTDSSRNCSDTTASKRSHFRLKKLFRDSLNS